MYFSKYCVEDEHHSSSVHDVVLILSVIPIVFFIHREENRGTGLLEKYTDSDNKSFLMVSDVANDSGKLLFV